MTSDAPATARAADPAAPSGGRKHDFRLLLTAFVVSAAGDWLYKLALPLIVLKLTGSPIQTAVVYSLEYVPYLLFAGIGGVISDRYDRRWLLIRAQAAATAVSGVLAVMAWLDQYHLWAIYACAFLLSSLTPLYQASFLGMVPSTVPADRLDRANSRIQAGQGMLDLAGPVAGAAAVAVLGARWALSLDAVSFALSAFCVALLARTAAEVRRSRAGSDPDADSGAGTGAGTSTVRAELREAARFVVATPALLWGAIIAAGSALGLSMVEGTMIAYLVRYDHQAVAQVGVVFAALGAGSLAGAVLAPAVMRRLGQGRAIIAAVLVGGIGTILLTVVHRVPAISAVWVVVGASTAVFIVSYATLRHRLVPDELLGRVVVLTRVIAFVAVPVAPLIGGALLAATGEFWPVLVVAAAAQFGTAGVAVFTPLWGAGRS